MRDCKTCIHSEIGHGEGNGCTAWTCEYINKKEALKAYKEQMEIVRCKYCKLMEICPYKMINSEENGYCSLGKRKEE